MKTLLLCLLVGSVAAAQRQPVERETGVNVRDHGAVGDGVADDTAAIQAAVDAALSSPARRAIHLPGARAYRITRPILVHASDFPLIAGEGNQRTGGTRIQAQNFIGPIFHVRGAAAYEDLTFVPSLARGTGHAVAFTQHSYGTAAWLDLVDAGASARLDGLAQCTVALFLRMDATTSEEQQVVRSFGSLYGTATSAYRIAIDTRGHLRASFTVNGSVHEVTAGDPLPPGRVYYVELSYDGAAVRLFYGIPGQTVTLAGEHAASGSISQSLFETMALSGVRGVWPHGPPLSNPIQGAIDSIHISRTARHAGPFTAPTNKHRPDANTLILENFDNETADFSIVYTSNGTAYIPKRSQRGGTHGSHLDLGHLVLEPAQGGAGLFLHGVILSRVHDLTVTSGIWGIDAYHDVFEVQFERLDFVMPSNYARAAIAATAQTGINHYRDINATGLAVALVARTGSGIVTNLYSTGDRQVIPLVLHEGSWVVHSMHFSNEDAGADTYVANMYLSANDNVEIVGGEFERYVNAGPAIVVGAGNKSLTIVGGTFKMAPDAAEVVRIEGAPLQPMVLINSYKNQRSVPWSTDRVNLVTLPAR